MTNAPESVRASRSRFALSWQSVALSVLAATLCVIIGSYGAWNALGRPNAGIDDANIFFVYAKNIAHGYGMVYNVGGEHVEGFSSMLYVLICSVVFWVNRSPELCLFVLNLLFTIATTLLVLTILNLLAERLDLGRMGKLLFGTAYLVWLVANLPYFAWNVVTLMDSGLYTIMLTAGYAFLALLLLRETKITIRHGFWLGLICALCILSRPEGIGWALVQAFTFACMCWTQSRSVRATLQLAVIPVAFIVLTYAGLIGFRELYFGYPLPNTYYAKVSSSHDLTLGYGKDAVKFFALQYGVLFLLPLIFGSLWILYTLLTRKPTTRLFWFAALTALFAIVGLAMPVAEGGDHFGSSRMFQSIYPILGITLVAFLFPFAKSRKLSFVAAYVLCVGVVIGLTTKVTWKSFHLANVLNQPGLPHAKIATRLDISNDFLLVASGRHLGEALNRTFTGGFPSVGVAAAGGIAYSYEGTVYDLLGLNDPRMAHADLLKVGPKDHASFSKKIFFQLAPDILLPVTVPYGTTVNLQEQKLTNGEPDNFENEVFKDIFHDDRFRSEYVLAVVRNPKDPTEAIYGYIRKAYLQDLMTNRGFEVLNSVAL